MRSARGPMGQIKADRSDAPLDPLRVPGSFVTAPEPARQPDAPAGP
jgi:hypothetical protein